MKSIVRDKYACACGAVTLEINNPKARGFLSFSMKKETFDAEFNTIEVTDEHRRMHNCNHCANNWGTDICACGSGEDPKTCSAGEHDCGEPSQSLEYLKDLLDNPDYPIEESNF